MIYVIVVLILSFNCQGQNSYPILRDKDIIYNLPPRVDSIVNLYVGEFAKQYGIYKLAESTVYLKRDKFYDSIKDELVNGYNLCLCFFGDTLVESLVKSNPFSYVRALSSRVIQITYKDTKYRIPVFINDFDDLLIGQNYRCDKETGIWHYRKIDSKRHYCLWIDFDLANNIYNIEYG